MTGQFKLIAFDADDLAVISAHVQDARIHVADIIWRQADKRLVIGLSRPDWDQTLAVSGGAPERVVSALRFDRVLACKSRQIDHSQPDQVLELIGIDFYPGEAPGGAALLMFKQGGAVRLDLECLECSLTDLGVDSFSGDAEGEASIVPPRAPPEPHS